MSSRCHPFVMPLGENGQESLWGESRDACGPRSSRSGLGAGWGRGGQAPLSEESCLGPQLRDKERQVIKERFKVSRDPSPPLLLLLLLLERHTPKHLSPGPSLPILLAAGLQ